MSPFLLAISIMVLTLVFVALRWGKAERANLPGNLGDTWPELDEWQQRTTEQNVVEALRLVDADPYPGGDTPVYSALTAQHPWVIEQLHPEEFAGLRAALADEDRVERWLA